MTEQEADTGPYAQDNERPPHPDYPRKSATFTQKCISQIKQRRELCESCPDHSVHPLWNHHDDHAADNDRHVCTQEIM